MDNIGIKWKGEKNKKKMNTWDLTVGVIDEQLWGQQWCERTDEISVSKGRVFDILVIKPKIEGNLGNRGKNLIWGLKLAFLKKLPGMCRF